MPAHFDPEALKFLRGLARNNDREWFESRRTVYERFLKAPMLALVDEINAAMIDFAPEHLRPAHKIVFRIYRDTRFSKDKQPYKAHLAAWWSRHGMEKTSGAGYYLQIDPRQVMVAAGVYMPEREQLLALRRWMSVHHESYRAMLGKLLQSSGSMRARRAGFEPIDADTLTRVPKGFARDDPADELIRAKSWGVHAFLPAQLALEPSLGREIVRRFRMAAPLVNNLNSGILHRDESGLEGAAGRLVRRSFF